MRRYFNRSWKGIHYEKFPGKSLEKDFEKVQLLIYLHCSPTLASEFIHENTHSYLSENSAARNVKSQSNEGSEARIANVPICVDWRRCFRYRWKRESAKRWIFRFSLKRPTYIRGETATRHISLESLFKVSKKARNFNGKYSSLCRAREQKNDYRESIE